tara:strand:- start:726 stop:1691 length:966 start_codon:yes stop_codon:yes gene_type:complete
MANGISNTGNPLYPGYATAQDASNETNRYLEGTSIVSKPTYTSNFFPHMEEAFRRRELGPYNVSGDLKSSVLGSGVTGGTDMTTTATPATTGGGFGQDFVANMSSPQAMFGMASGIGGIIQGLVGRGKRRDAQIAAQDEYDKMRQQYMDLDTSNIYANVENKYLNMENVYEDLTVNQQQAEFEKRMFEQQQAGIMQNLRGAAGGSGIAGLAQALSNQALVQSQKAAGSIGLQESRNQIYSAQEASRIQQLERRGEAQAEALRLAGEETSRGLEYQKTGTLFGMSQQDLAAANQAIAQSDAALYGGIGSLVGTAASAAIGAA